MSRAARSNGSGAGHQIVVVTSRKDLPEGLDGVVTANEFLTGGARWAKPRATVVNLCRSLHYLSKGYYVSLLASARDQRALPGVETLREVTNRHTLLRHLEEDDVPCVEETDETLARKRIEHDEGREGSYRFLTTGEPAAFRALGERFLQLPLGEVEHVAVADLVAPFAGIECQRACRCRARGARARLRLHAAGNRRPERRGPAPQLPQQE